MDLDPRRYGQIPRNELLIAAGTLLFPTDIPIVAGGGTSLAFVHDQGGCDETFVFLLGARTALNIVGAEVDVLEGVLLTPRGPIRDFLPTWDYHQLLREVGLGGWRVVPTEEVLRSWTDVVEARMNA